MEFVHIGVPTKKVQENEIYLEALKVYVTDAEAHDYKYEYLRFEEDSPIAKEIQTQTHVAIKVDSIEEELKKGEKVLCEPFDGGDYMIAFMLRDGTVIELMEPKKK